MAPLKRSSTAAYGGGLKRQKVVAVRAMSKSGADMEDIKTRVASLSRQLAQVKSSREVKHLDVGLVSSAVGYDTDEVHNLGAVPQGPVSDERIGESISPTHIHIRGALVNGPSVQTHSTVRLVLVQMRDSTVPQTLTAVGKTQILDNQGTAEAVFSHFEWDNIGKYTVLADRTYSLDGTQANDQDGLNFSMKVRLRRKIKYVTSTSTAESGGIYLLMYADRPATSAIAVRFQSRLFFHDD